MTGDPMEVWQTVLLAIGSNTVAIAVLAFVGKSLFEKIIARDSARFEIELKAKFDGEMQRLKSELELKSIEHQVRFSRLHEKRADCIAKLYSLLVESLWEAESFLTLVEWNGEPSKKEKHITAMNQLVKTFRYFDKHRIYFNDDMCQSMESMLRETRRLMIEFGIWVQYDPATLTERSAKEKHETWVKNYETFKNEIPKEMRKLENEFRTILGIIHQSVKSDSTSKLSI